ncbi:hypothetical protein Q2T40_04945 [Winogradskyella maritima]|nr:hypothetical protein [Winogradskyella maritima]
MRVSYQNLDQEGTLPNTDLERNSLSFTGSLNLSDKIKVNANLNYVKTDSDNSQLWVTVPKVLCISSSGTVDS